MLLMSASAFPVDRFQKHLIDMAMLCFKTNAVIMPEMYALLYGILSRKHSPP